MKARNFASLLGLIAFTVPAWGMPSPEGQNDQAVEIVEEVAKHQFQYFKNAVIYSGTVGDMPVSVNISSRPFDPAAHKIEKKEDNGVQWSVDGKLISGADGLPEKGCPQLSGLVVQFGSKSVSVPGHHLDHYFNPSDEKAIFDKFGNVGSEVRFDPNGRFVWVALGLADGAIGTRVEFRIYDDGCVITEDPEYLEDVVIYQGSANGVAVKVTASSRPFRRASHKTRERTERTEGADPDTWRAMIDGSSVIGTYGELPEDGDPQLSNVIVSIGKQTIRIPADRLSHVIWPQIKKGSTVTVSADAEVVHVELSAGTIHPEASLPILVTKDGGFEFKSTFFSGP